VPTQSRSAPRGLISSQRHVRWPRDHFLTPNASRHPERLQSAPASGSAFPALPAAAWGLPWPLARRVVGNGRRLDRVNVCKAARRLHRARPPGAAGTPGARREHRRRCLGPETGPGRSPDWHQPPADCASGPGPWITEGTDSRLTGCCRLPGCGQSDPFRHVVDGLPRQVKDQVPRRSYPVQAVGRISAPARAPRAGRRVDRLHGTGVHVGPWQANLRHRRGVCSFFLERPMPTQRRSSPRRRGASCSSSGLTRRG
jgi:hypothetical protein